MSLTYEVLATDGAARRGRLQTAHGAVNTPAFMPVGTAGTVKAMTVEAVAATGAANPARTIAELPTGDTSSPGTNGNSLALPIWLVRPRNNYPLTFCIAARYSWTMSNWCWVMARE